MINARLPLIDFKWSQIGDFILDNGDLDDTSKKFGLGFLQEIRSRVSDAIGSWKTKPELGCNIDTFEGLLNNPDTAKRLVDDLKFSLTKDGFLEQSDFDLTPVPVSNTAILIRLQFNGILTTELPDSTIIFSIIFDLAGRGPFLVNS